MPPGSLGFPMLWGLPSDPAATPAVGALAHNEQRWQGING